MVARWVDRWVAQLVAHLVALVSKQSVTMIELTEGLFFSRLTDVLMVDGWWTATLVKHSLVAGKEIQQGSPVRAQQGVWIEIL